MTTKLFLDALLDASVLFWFVVSAAALVVTFFYGWAMNWWSLACAAMCVGYWAWRKRMHNEALAALAAQGGPDDRT